jgi:hypothetical protein
MLLLYFDTLILFTLASFQTQRHQEHLASQQNLIEGFAVISSFTRVCTTHPRHPRQQVKHCPPSSKTRDLCEHLKFHINNSQHLRFRYIVSSRGISSNISTLFNNFDHASISRHPRQKCQNAVQAPRAARIWMTFQAQIVMR